MSRKRGAPVAPVGSLERLRAEIRAADRFITTVTWGCAAGMVLWSMLNATPYVSAHVADGWENTAFVLPLVVDMAFVGALRADEIASRHDVKAGVWPVLLRLFTGAASVFLNIGHSVEKGDTTGVLQHLVAPGLLVLLAEAGPAWRRSLAAKVTAAEREAEREADRADRAARVEADRLEAARREEAERLRVQELEAEERRRLQRIEDEDRQEEREARRASDRAAREMEAKRLDLEGRKLELTAARPAPVHVPVAPVVSGPVTGETGLQARTGADSAAPVARHADIHATAPQARTEPLAPILAARTAPAAGTVHARIEKEHQDQRSVPQCPATPPKDWEHDDIPTEAAPGIAPALLTDEQSRARIRYGLAQEWTQRRIGEFAGRSATTVNKVKSSLPRL
ncbi:hypothetical protein ACFXKG_40380 [Streptomyces sp. NPDC059255]|uniref:hypothetical protein n=1 Tax=Streptomyces sp. NPDC059255 TaxID=3346793 RepID=UPI0036AD1051